MVALIGLYRGRPRYHAYVIYGKNQTDDDYYNVTKATTLNDESVTQLHDHIKNKIIETQGTDILIYTM
jgi:hypothetical protein